MTITIYDANGPRNISSAQFMEKVNKLRNTSFAPFSSEAIAALSYLSESLLNHALVRQFPQIIALGYWLRPSALQKIKDNHFSESPNLRTVARGLAFHLPPSNVDTLFVYSWAMSLLAGNSNIVRLPQKASKSTHVLLDAVCQTLKQPQMESSQLMCKYDKTSKIGNQISSCSDMRIIWGGDEKVGLISSEPMSPGGLSIGFPDRTSFCVVSNSGFQKLDDREKKKLVIGLYNDIFWFNQLGCSSPKALCWIGGDEAADELYGLLNDVIQEKQMSIETGTTIDKFVFANVMIASGQADRIRRKSNELTILEANTRTNIEGSFPGGGFLLHIVCPNITDIKPLITRKIQTITHMAMTIEQIDKIASLLDGNGGLRLVPAGDALSFGPVWDGYDLFNTLTRRVVIDYGSSQHYH